MSGPSPAPRDGEPAHILCVDDDNRLRDLLRRYLSDKGFMVTTAETAAEARRKMNSVAFDLLVLDLMMPGETGLSFARSLREAGDQVPILMLTAMAEAEDRITGLEHGADDYLVKPFDPRELVLRINSILRRVSPAAAPSEMALGRFVFDAQRAELRCGAEVQRLTSTEAALLGALAERPGDIVSREALSAKVGTGGNERTIDVQVTRLRRKIEPDPKTPRYLQTVRGKGYRLQPD